MTDQQHPCVRADCVSDKGRDIAPVFVDDCCTALVATVAVGHARRERVTGERDHEDASRGDLNVVGQPVAWRAATKELWNELSSVQQRAQILGGLLCERVPDEHDVTR